MTQNPSVRTLRREADLQYRDGIREEIEEAFRRKPSVMTPILAQKLAVREVDVIRHYPDNRACELAVARWEDLISQFETLGKVYVVVNTGVVVLERFGEFGNLSKVGPWFNVQSSSLDLHIRFEQLGSVFAVEKPGHMDGVDTLSFQFFTKEGHSAFKVFLTFGGREAAPEKVTQFNRLREQFKLARVGSTHRD